MTVTLILSELEANQMAKLLDSAVRADGLQAAAAAVSIFTKLRAALADAQAKEAVGAVQS